MSTSPRKYHHGDLRETLLRAAERMIDSDVARDFSLRELAREAGVSHAAPYKHFTERREIVLALAERWMDDFVGAQREASDPADAAANLVALGAAYVRYADAHPSRFAVIFDPSINRPGAQPTAGFAEAVQEHTQLLHRAVERAAGAGVVAHGGPATAAALWSLVHGLATLVTLGYLSYPDTEPILSALVDLTGGPEGVRS